MPTPPEIHSSDCCCSKCAHPSTTIHRRHGPVRFTIADWFVLLAITSLLAGGFSLFT